VELPKYRAYTRDLDKKQIETLKSKYKEHAKVSREGFLNPSKKERLLHITRGRDESNREISDFFYEIRERAKSAITDMQLLCDTLNEDQLEQIFGARESFTHEKQVMVGNYLIVNLLKSLIPYSFQFGKDKLTQEQLKEREWRKHFLSELIVEGLLWYFHSGIFKSDSHLNLLFDALDTITVMSTGKKKYQRTVERGISIVTF